MYIRYKMVVFGLLCSLSGVFLSFAAGNQPRQFDAWGKYGPSDLAKRSLPPEGWKEVMPRDNLTMPPQLDSESKERGWVVFSRPTFDLVFPVTAPMHSEISSVFSVFATPGEYVPVTFSVRALRDLADFRVILKEVKNEKGDRIPLENIDLRVVRYLPMPAGMVDYSRQPEVIKENEYIVAPGFMEHFESMSIRNNTTQQFWYTIKLPETLSAGIYNGEISLRCGEYNQRISLRIRVLPFTLKKVDPSQMVFSILYNGTDKRGDSWGRGIYNNNLSKDFIDMAEHGLTSTGYMYMSPYFCLDNGKLVIAFDKPCSTSSHSLEDIMKTYINAGLTGPIEYQKGPYWEFLYGIRSQLGYEKYTQEFGDVFKSITKATVEKIKTEGWPEFIFMIGDEPGSHTERLKGCSYCGKLIKEVAPKVRISNYFNGDWDGTKDWLLLKEVTDICCTNYTSEGIQAEQRAVGYKDIWVYNGGSAGASIYPNLDRIYYGFHVWRIGASGVTQYIYQTVAGDAFNHLDLDPYPPRGDSPTEYLYTYPTPEGPLPTLDWEGVRAGIYDWRYLSTLESLIERARNNKSPQVKQAVEQAAKELENIREKFRPDFQSHAKREILLNISPRDLDVYRWHIAKQIINLQSLMQ